MERKTESRLLIAKALKRATVSYFLKKGYSCFEELGLNSWGKLRGDVVCINLKGEIILCEIKSSKSDFLLDKKWETYLPYGNKHYVVMMPSVFDTCKAHVVARLKPHGAGVLILDERTGYLRAVLPAKRKKMKKKAKRLLTIRMAWRNGISKRNARRQRQYVTE